MFHATVGCEEDHHGACYGQANRFRFETDIPLVFAPSLDPASLCTFPPTPRSMKKKHPGNMKDNLSSSYESQSSSSWSLTWSLTTNTSGGEMLMCSDVTGGPTVIISSALSLSPGDISVAGFPLKAAVSVNPLVHSLPSLCSESRQSGNISLHPLRDLRTKLTWNVNDSWHSHIISWLWLVGWTK